MYHNHFFYCPLSSTLIYDTRNKYLRCYVTILNKTKEYLILKEAKNYWSKYASLPKKVISPYGETSFHITGWDSATPFCEGSVEYYVGNTGLGTVKFNYSCPYIGDNKAYCIYNIKGFICKVYANNQHAYEWKEPYGTEGHIPVNGYPLSVLFILEEIANK